MEKAERVSAKKKGRKNNARINKKKGEKRERSEKLLLRG